MALSEQQKQELHTQYASKTDDALYAMLQNRTLSDYHPDVIDIVAAIWKSRGHTLPPDPKIWESRGHKLSNNAPVPKHRHWSGTTRSPLYPLTTLCAKWYYLMFELGLWLIPIAGTISGGAMGHSVARYSSDGVGLVIGAIIGFVASFLIMLNIGGLLSVFLKLCQDVAKIAKSKS